MTLRSVHVGINGNSSSAASPQYVWIVDYCFHNGTGCNIIIVTTQKESTAGLSTQTRRSAPFSHTFLTVSWCVITSELKRRETVTSTDPVTCTKFYSKRFWSLDQSKKATKYDCFIFYESLIESDSYISQRIWSTINRSNNIKLVYIFQNKDANNANNNGCRYWHVYNSCSDEGGYLL